MKHFKIQEERVMVFEVPLTWKFWPFPPWVRGVVLYPFILYQEIPDIDIRRHEWAHVCQIRKEGIIKFYFKYKWYSHKYGYRDNPYEKEAREKQYDEEFNPWEH